MNGQPSLQPQPTVQPINPIINQANSTLKKAAKYPSLGLYMSFKAFLEMLLYMIQCMFRGIVFIIHDLPVLAWQKASGKVDEAVKGSQKDAQVDENGNPIPGKKSLLSMDLNDILKNSQYMKKKMANLDRQKVLLAEELNGPGAIRTKEAKIYQFTAKNADGKIETGIMSGFSKLDINTFLVQDGYDVYKIENNKQIDFLYGQSSIFAPKLKTKDLLFWLTQLSTYLKSGISLTESIRILNKQMKNKSTYRRAFQSIIYELTMGEAFSTALEKQGDMFPALLINMIKAAEATGQLEETLDDMANYYEEIDRTRKQMISAMTYPTIIVIFSIGVVAFILVWVVPQFVSMYKSAGATIGGMTLFVINLSTFLKNYLVPILLILLAVNVVIIFCYKKIKAFRRSLQIFAMKLPVFGKLIIYNEMTIFAKTFASLLHNNVFITDSITILSKITNNEIYKEIMYNTIDNIVKGEKISLAFKDNWAVPDVAYYMIVTGESTGQLAEMMTKVSAYYQEMHRNMVGSLKALIEPITIAFLAVVVGGIILSVIVPMFNLMNEIK